MGDRYIITVKCSECEFTEDDVYYAPTCGINSWKCPMCGHITNLEEYTGISYEDASNLDIIQEIVDAVSHGQGEKDEVGR